MLEMNQSTTMTDFLGDGFCLILEPSQSFSFAVQNTLQAMGVAYPKILTARRTLDARRIILEKKPRVLISEYEIEDFSALELFELQKAQCESFERLALIITLNSSDAAVAEASEGEIDGYLLKPFSMTDLRQKLEQILASKMNPSAYAMKLNLGKKLLASQSFEKAAQEFLLAKPLDPQPTMACFYAGQAFQALGDTSRALLEFKEGLNYHPLHYRCLTGEFDSLIEAKDYQSAYQLIGPIKSNFPVTSVRLGQFFVVAVFANHFEVLPHFCKMVVQLEQKSQELITISSLAMLTSGKHSLKQQHFETAHEAFELGFQLSGKSFDFLEKVVNEYLKLSEHQKAQAFFNKASPADFDKISFRILEFRVGQHTLSHEGLIKKGQQLIDEGHGNAEIYLAMVKAMALQGKAILASTFISKIQRTHPELSFSLYQELEKNLKTPDN